ncbi:hypothetical protein AYK26_07710 [Euryarchaeota archaeon SM23-78]|nr:MAG: hypothetical protein AYK26_07710 [Euryarchaeota archaeon SM23-78]
MFQKNLKNKKNKMPIGIYLRTEKHKENLRLSHLGQKAWNKGKKFPQFSGENHPRWKGGKPYCIICGKKLSFYGYKRCRKCLDEYCVGENNHNWKGGYDNTILRLRRTKKYYEWRRNIFIRDKFMCQECGKKHIYIEAHHIKDFVNYPELRFDINNGLTLCRECHKQTNNFSRKNKRKVQKEI